MQATSYSDSNDDADLDDDDFDDQFGESEDIDDIFSEFAHGDNDCHSECDDHTDEVEMSDHEDNHCSIVHTENITNVPPYSPSHSPVYSECTNDLEDENNADQTSDDNISVCTEISFNAPPYSPLSPSEVVGVNLDDINMDTFFVDDFHTDCSTAASFTPLYENSVTTPLTTNHASELTQFSQAPRTTGGDSASHTQSVESPSCWRGFKLVGDNLDKNIRPSFQRFNNRTDSLHYFHHYALLD